MAYRSNLAELPALVETLLGQGLAWQVEIRHTFDEAHIPQAFRDAEYLTTEEYALPSPSRWPAPTAACVAARPARGPPSSSAPGP